VDRVQRVQCVLEGNWPDRPPLSFWHHFPPDQVHGPRAVSAHLNHLHTWDLDFLKVMNDNGYPFEGRIESVRDLAALKVLRGDETQFARQLDLLHDLQRELRGCVLMVTTTFNAWATLRRLIEPPKGHGPPNLDAVPDPTSERIKAFLREDEDAVLTALRTIAESLANFARRCIEAGADGIYLSVRDDWLHAPGDPSDLYDRVVRPTDHIILEGASRGQFNIVHVCGRPVDLRPFAEYPAQVLHWADRAAGPSIAETIGWVRPAICGGLDNQNTLPHGTPEQCADEVRDALRQTGQRPILLAPGCTYDPDAVPRENLQAICRAVRE